MTVAELIEKLSEFPGDTLVAVKNEGCGCCFGGDPEVPKDVSAMNIWVLHHREGTRDLKRLDVVLITSVLDDPCIADSLQNYR